MYSAGTAYLSVVPSFRGIERAFQREAEKIGRQVDRSIANSIPQGVREGMDRADRDVQRTGGRAGERYAGAFSDAMKRRLDKALSSIRAVEITADSSELDRKLADVRKDLAELRDAVINVDVDSDFAMLELRRIAERIRELQGQDAEIEVHFNLASAMVELEALEQAADRMGNRSGDEWGGSFVRQIRERVRVAAATISDINIGVDTTQAQFDLGALRARLVALGDVHIGVDMDLGVFMAEVMAIENALVDLEMNGDINIQTRLEAAAARAGLTALHQQINEVDRDDIEINVDTNSAGANLMMLGEMAGVSMGRLGALIAVGATLGTALVPAAAVAAASISAIGVAAGVALAGVGALVLGLFGVVKAVTAMDKYQQDADKSGRNLSQTQARVAGAMDQVRGAASNVQTAERNLARAQKDATESVKELTKAREEARRQLEDMALAVKSTALAQRQARLDEADAKKELDKILANPRATEAEREQARITHEERLLQIQELGVRQGRQVKDEQEARKKGIEGSDQVKAAQERIAQAMERVVAATESVADSQRSLEAANRSLQQAYEQTGVAGGEAMRDLQRAMDSLSPAGRRFAAFIFGLKDDFKSLQHAAEEGLLPGLQQAIENLLPFLAPLGDFVFNVAKAMGDGFAYATERLKDPIWRQFFGYIAEVAGPAIRGMFEFFMNLAEGIAGVLMGLSGFNGPIGQGVLQWSRDFAQWGTTLDSNSGWQKFLQYVKDSWPEVRDFFSGLWDFTKKFVTAAAPIGEWVVGAFAKLFDWMNQLDSGTWTVIIGAIAGVAAALLLVAGVTALVAGGWTTLLVAAIAAVVAGLIWLYQNVDPVRKVMDATWKAIQVGWDWLWNQVLKPGWALLVQGVQNLGDAFAKLDHDIFQPLGETASLIFEVIRGAWDRMWIFIGPALENAKTGFRVFGAILLWLWDHVAQPVFGFIQVGFSILYAAFQVFLGLFQIGIKIWASGFFWIWDNVVAPLWEKLKPFFSWLGDIISKYVEPRFREGLRLLSKAWDIFVDGTKAPIKIIVNTLLNDGLLKGYNAVAKFFKVHPDDVHIDLPAGFARGGAVRGPGTSTSDSILARLSRGEHVWTAEEVEAAGGHEAVLGLRRSVLQGMKLDGLLPGFKSGGWWDDALNAIKHAGSAVIGGAKDFVGDPGGYLRKLYQKMLDRTPGRDAQVMQVVLGMPSQVLNLAVDKVKGLFGVDGGGTPGNWPSSPEAQRGDSGVWRSIVALINSTGPLSGSFGNAYRPGDPLWHGSGRAVDWMGYNQDALATFLAARQPLELIHRTNTRDYAYTRGRNMGSFDEGLMEEHRNHVHIAMDQGGWLQPGYSVIFNGTGAPEPVLTAQQWRDINVVARQGGDGGGGPSYHFQFRDTTLDASKLRALQDREAALARVGRAR